MASDASAPTVTAPRLVSLDALRGFDMFWILGADALVHALGQMNSSTPVTWLVSQLTHKDWAGFAFYDLIFPLFVFIVGVSLVFSLPKTIAQHGRAAAVRRIMLRATILFLLGIFYNGGLTRPWPDVRLVGVLQRIALVYAAAGLLFCFFKPRILVGAFVALLVGYWALLTFVPIRVVQLERTAIAVRLAPGDLAPGTKPPLPPLDRVREVYHGTTATVTGTYEPGLNVANHFDFEHLPGGKYNTYWDPEGWLSTLPAIATGLLGVFAGLLLRRADLSGVRKTGYLAAGGAVALTFGWWWHLQFPVIKNLWTSSFVLVAGGYSLFLLAGFYFVVDVRGRNRWCRPFVWIGMNPITLYLATSAVSFDRIARRFVGGDVAQFFDRAVAPGFGQLVIACATLALLMLLAWFLHARKIFLRV